MPVPHEENVKGKVYVVTGGSTGIGYSLVTRLAKLGAKVVIANRNEADGQKAVADCASISGRPASEFLFVKTDVTNNEECVKLHNTAIEKFGGYDGLVLNSGGSPADRNTFLQWDDAVGGFHDGWLDDLKLNLIAPLYSARLAAKYWNDTGRDGVLVFTVSYYAYAPCPIPVYGLSKCALNHFAHNVSSMAKEGFPLFKNFAKIRINTITPGVVRLDPHLPRPARGGRKVPFHGRPHQAARRLGQHGPPDRRVCRAPGGPGGQQQGRHHTDRRQVHLPEAVPRVGHHAAPVRGSRGVQVGDFPRRQQEHLLSGVVGYGGQEMPLDKRAFVAINPKCLRLPRLRITPSPCPASHLGFPTRHCLRLRQRHPADRGRPWPPWSPLPPGSRFVPIRRCFRLRSPPRRPCSVDQPAAKIDRARKALTCTRTTSPTSPQSETSAMLPSCRRAPGLPCPSRAVCRGIRGGASGMWLRRRCRAGGSRERRGTRSKGPTKLLESVAPGSQDAKGRQASGDALLAVPLDSPIAAPPSLTPVSPPPPSPGCPPSSLSCRPGATNDSPLRGAPFFRSGSTSDGFAWVGGSLRRVRTSGRGETRKRRSNAMRTRRDDISDFGWRC